MSVAEEIRFLDTTLRDGEQAPGIALSGAQKLEIAEQLGRLGVDVIESGFPASSPGQFEAVRRIAARVHAPVIAALCRARAEDIDRAWEAIREADRGRLKVFMSTSDIHLQWMLRMSRAEALEAARQGVRHARAYTNDVQFSAQDCTRTDPEFLLQVFEVAVAEGATTVSLPDTVGYALPDDFGELVRMVREAVPDDVTVSTHCHNDLGMAVANSFAGVMNGARQVEVTVNGIGERAGNCSLEEMAMVLSTRGREFGLIHRLNLGEIAETSRLVSELSGVPLQPNKAVVGANAFTHESGIHQHGVLVNPETYEIMDPTEIGRQGSHIVLGRHSGRRGFAHVLAGLGLRLDPEGLDRAFVRFKELADGNGLVSREDLEAVVAEELPGNGERAIGLD